MEITFLGHSCFKLKGKGITVLIDPFDPKEVGLKFPSQKADVVVVSHNHDDHNYLEGVSGPVARNEIYVIDRPGEYEIGGVEIKSYSTCHDDKEGKERGRNLVSIVRMEDVFLAHLGDLGHELSEKKLEGIGGIDVLLVPVGGKVTLGAKEAVKVVKQLEPSLIIPMHYQEVGLSDKYSFLAPVDDFVKEMGAESKMVREKKLRVVKADLETEEGKIVIMEV